MSDFQAIVGRMLSNQKCCQTRRADLETAPAARGVAAEQDIDLGQAGHGLRGQRSHADAACLHLVESVIGPTTVRFLDKIDVASGSTCLELDAGDGSIARWLSSRVGPTGRVVLVNIAPGSMIAIDPTNTEVRHCNIEIEALESARYDLIYSRTILGYFADPVGALQRLVKALRPGGWLLLEHPEGRPPWMDPRTARGAEFNRLSGLIYTEVASHGVDLGFGSRLLWRAAELGLTDVEGEVTARTMRGGPLASHASLRLMQRWRRGLVASGRITEANLDAMLAAFADPNVLITDSSSIVVCGRKP